MSLRTPVFKTGSLTNSEHPTNIHLCKLYHPRVQLTLMKLRHALVAGTFDHLHQGHQKLLKTAIQTAARISCGLTNSSFVSHKPLAQLIQPRPTRYSRLSSLLSNQTSNWSIFPLKHPFEPAASSNQFDTIIASTETAPTVKHINRLRLHRRLKPLKPIIINLIKSSDQKSLSSARIRQGQINRQGFVYQQIFSNKTLTLPSLQRHHFQRPFDTLIQGSQTHLGWAGLQAKQLLTKNPAFKIITVGDIATISLIQQSISPDLAIVDLKTQRQPLFSSLRSLGLHSHHRPAPNPPGQITSTLVKTINQSLTDLINHPLPQTILVKGEEDLAVLPAILLSPLNTAIFYGQPQQGLVAIRVTETKKQKALNLLRKLT